MLRKNQAQSILAYVVLIAVIAVALLAVRVYFTRAVQEKFRQTGDAFGSGDQYAPGVTKNLAP